MSDKALLSPNQRCVAIVLLLLFIQLWLLLRTHDLILSIHEESKQLFGNRHLFLFQTAQPHEHERESEAETDVLQSVAVAVQKAGGYIVRSVQSDGRFCYNTYLEYPDAACNMHKYNLLRHAGAIYALGMLEASYPKTVPFETVLPAVRWLLDPSRAHAPRQHPDALAMWEASGGKAKLGGAALALVALTVPEVSGLVEGAPSYGSHVTQRLGDFLLHMQRDSGEFQSLYYEGHDEQEHEVRNGIHEAFAGEWTSLYYEGEAALALIRLHTVTKQQKYLDGAVRAMMYLADLRKGMAVDDVPPDGWALVATGALLRLRPESNFTTALVVHGEQVVRSMLFGPSNIDAEKAKTQRVATRLEGLLAFYPFIRDEALRGETLQTATRHVKRLCQLQISTGALAGAWTDDVEAVEKRWRYGNERTSRTKSRS
eukprot:TRINITY_DN73807_c0_g1_i1.p1 TRINITY_DN73807_c0_g1~~TRINITY_DN73807_c0_g1_i1.p1  ORF type:complete len:428 (-),score=56.58 TRINITY_DN73807_c0_g1_i1:2-1285(-)